MVVDGAGAEVGGLPPGRRVDRRRVVVAGDQHHTGPDGEDEDDRDRDPDHRAATPLPATVRPEAASGRVGARHRGSVCQKGLVTRGSVAAVFDRLLQCFDVEEHVVLRSPVGFLALHGGIEPGTEGIAVAASVASGASAYVVTQPRSLGWHVSSHRIVTADVPRLAAFLDHVDVVVSVHGYFRPEQPDALFVGGGRRDLAGELAARLRAVVGEMPVIDDAPGDPEVDAGDRPAQPGQPESGRRRAARAAAPGPHRHPRGARRATLGRGPGHRRAHRFRSRRRPRTGGVGGSPRGGRRAHRARPRPRRGARLHEPGALDPGAGRTGPGRRRRSGGVPPAPPPARLRARALPGPPRVRPRPRGRRLRPGPRPGLLRWAAPLPPAGNHPGARRLRLVRTPAGEPVRRRTGGVGPGVRRRVAEPGARPPGTRTRRRRRATAACTGRRPGLASRRPPRSGCSPPSPTWWA